MRIHSKTANGIFKSFAPRLFRNIPGLRFHGAIHEQLNLEDDALSLSGAESDIVIHHAGYLPDVYQEKNKSVRNMKLLQREVESNPTGFNLYELGLQHYADGDYEQAFQTFVQAFPLSQGKMHLASMLYQMVQCAWKLQRIEAGINLALESLVSYPQYTALHFVLGQLYKEAGYLADAERCFRTCLRLGDVQSLDVAPEGCGTYLAHCELADVLDRAGRIQEALDEIRKSLHAGKNKQALQMYLEWMLRQNAPLQKTREELRRMFPVEEPEDLASLLMVCAGLKHPMLESLIEEHQLALPSEQRAVAKLHAGQWEQARRLWESSDRVAPGSEADLVLLGMFIEQEGWLERFRHHLNFSHREWKMLQRFVALEEPAAPLSWTNDMERMLLAVARSLVIMQEFERFERVLKWMQTGSADLQAGLARMLVEFGFEQVAFDLLLHVFHRHQNHAGVLELMGDLCLRHGSIEDADTLYRQRFQQRPDFPGWWRLYQLSEAKQDWSERMRLLKMLKDRFPLSQLSVGAV